MAPARARIDRRLAERGGAVELLRLPSALFAGLTRLRAAGYERGWLARIAVPLPVVSVGNVTAGGTGKTPFVAFLARRLAARGKRVGILSRGYGAPRGDVRRENDEARWYREHLPGAELVQEPDRVRGAEELLARGADVILLDDGFQHRRLARDLDLVLVDATRPWGLPPPDGGGAPVQACLPRGLMREPPAALARADALVITRSDQVAPRELDALRAELERVAPGRALLLGVHRPARLRGPDGRTHQLAELAGRELDLVSAIGNPEAFERTLQRLGARIASHRVFPDHHLYSRPDLEGLGADGRWLVTTEKDAVKLTELRALHVLGTDFELVEGAAVLDALLGALPASDERRRRDALHEGLHG